MKKVLHWMLIALLWLLLWWLAWRAVGQDIMVPSPQATLARLGELAGDRRFWLAAGVSMGRILCGFGLGVIGGILLAVVTYFSPWWRDFFSPLLSIVRATPIASFIILTLVWLSTGMVPVFIALLIVLPIVWTNLLTGLQNIDPQLLEMARAFAMPWPVCLRRIYIPSVTPYFSAALTTGLGMAWKAGIAAEVISIPHQSIGNSLYQSKIMLDTTSLFAWTITVILLSILLERALKHAMHKTAGYRRKQEAN